MKRLISMAALAAFAALAEEKTAAAPAKMEMPTPPPEMKVEQWFTGSWSCKGTQHASSMGPEMKTASKLDFRMELAGFWLQVKGTMMSGPMKGKEMFEGFASWDGTQHVRYDFAPAEMMRYTTKGWDGDKLVFTGDGTMMGEKKSAVQHTITRKGDNAFDSVFESDGKTMIEETCTRGGAAKTAAAAK